MKSMLLQTTKEKFITHLILTFNQTLMRLHL